MSQNFIESRREQGFLLPPDVRDSSFLADHLAWFVIGAVEGMDLSAFYAAYRADGHGGGVRAVDGGDVDRVRVFDERAVVASD